MGFISGIQDVPHSHSHSRTRTHIKSDLFGVRNGRCHCRRSASAAAAAAASSSSCPGTGKVQINLCNIRTGGRGRVHTRPNRNERMYIIPEGIMPCGAAIAKQYTHTHTRTHANTLARTRTRATITHTHARVVRWREERATDSHPHYMPNIYARQSLSRRASLAPPPPFQD